MAWNESPQSKILQFAQPLFPGSKVEVSGNRNTARGGKKPP